MPADVPQAPARRPEGAVLRSAGVPTAVVGALVVAVAALWGGKAVAGAAVGAALTLVTFALGPLVERTSARHSPPAQMALALGAYTASIGFLGVAYVLLAGVDWLSGTAAGVAIIVCAVVWTVGHAWAVARLRVLAYGSPAEGVGRHDAAGHDGSAESPGPASH